MFGREPIKSQPETHDLGSILNKLKAEVRRLGNIRAAAPLGVKVDASGIYLFSNETNVKVFAKLLTRLNYNSYVDAHLYRRNSTDTGWELVTESSDNSHKIKVYASPLWGSSDYLAANTKVQAEWFQRYNHFIVVNAECGV